MKRQIIICVSALSLMSATMVFAASTDTSSSYYKKNSVKIHNKSHKQKNKKKTTSTTTQPKVISQEQPQIKSFGEMPALHVWGYGGSHTIGEGQGLIPLMSSDQNKNLYLLAEAKETANTAAHYFGFGGGYRQVVNNNRIFGGYFIVDDNFTDYLADKNFFVLNPGLETLGDKWDFRVNGYFPLGSKSWDTGTSYQNIHFAGNNEFADVYNNTASIGNGADAEVGVKVPKLDCLKIFVGGYYFDEKDTGSITGASGRLEYKVNNYLTIEGRDTYDNYNDNKALIGFRVSLGGVENKGENGISDRLMDPIEHNLATAATANSVPIRTSSQLVATNHQVNTNPIEFVDDNGVENTSGEVTGSGTYEDPYTSLNDETIADIQSQQGDNAVDIYVEGGSDPYSVGGTLDLPNDYSIYGREDNFTQAATGDDRPELDGSINVSGNSTLDSLQIMNSDGNTTGITIGNMPPVFDANGEEITPIVNLNNVVVGSTTNTATMFQIGVDVQNAVLNVSNSEIYGYVNQAVTTDTGDADLLLAGEGIELGEGATVNLLENNIVSGGVLGSAVAGQPGDYDAYGINFTGTGVLNVRGDDNTISGVNTVDGSGNAYGINVAGEGSAVNISSDNNNIYGEINVPSGTSSDDVALSDGVAQGIYLAGAGESLSVTGSGNNISGTNNGNGDAYGIYDSEVDSSPADDSSAVPKNAITILGNRNTMAANTHSTSSTSSSKAIVSGGNLTVMGNNSIQSTANNSGSAVGVVFASDGILQIENSTVNVITNDVSVSQVDVSGIEITDVVTGSPTSVEISNVTMDVSVSMSSVSNPVGINILSSNVNAFVITNNRINVSGTNATGIKSLYALTDPTTAAWQANNTFGGTIPPDRQVIIGQ